MFHHIQRFRWGNPPSRLKWLHCMANRGHTSRWWVFRIGLNGSRLWHAKIRPNVRNSLRWSGCRSRSASNISYCCFAHRTVTLSRVVEPVVSNSGVKLNSWSCSCSCAGYGSAPRSKFCCKSSLFCCLSGFARSVE